MERWSTWGHAGAQKMPRPSSAELERQWTSEKKTVEHLPTEKGHVMILKNKTATFRNV